jgi:hypothetical protein
MNSAVELHLNAIVTRSRGITDILTFGRWRRTCTLDFQKKIVEEKTVRLTKSNVLTHPYQTFDAVDYSYECLSLHSRDGMDFEVDEYRVGLRYAANGKVFPLAAFWGTVETPYGLAAFIVSAFPASWSEQNFRHEAEARSLANLLCQKLQLELAI